MSRNYPKKIEIERAVTAAKACGVDVATIEVLADGTIKMSDARDACTAG